MRGVTDVHGSVVQRSAGRVARIARGLLRSSTRGRYIAAARQRAATIVSRGPLDACIVCGSVAARVVTVTDATAAARGAPAKTFHVRICRACGHVGNPENIFDYRHYEQIDKLTEAGRIGTAERPGREFHMASMAAEILGRDDLEVLVYGAGRSLDNAHISALPQVRHVAVADVMRLRDDAEFIDANLPAPRRFGIVVASEVVEHFLDPRPDFAGLFDFVEPDGLLVCGTNVYDGRTLANQSYIFVPGHTSYYSPRSLARIADENGFHLDMRIPLVATGYAGPRKRYLLFTRSPAVVDAIGRYFSTRPYAPSESPTADRELAEARGARR
jgi:hypothetical protein